MSPSSISHVILLPLLVWGHARPLCTLAVRLVSERKDVIVTYLTTSNLHSKVVKEISREFSSDTDPRLRRLRIVSIFQSTQAELLELFVPYVISFPPVYRALSEEQPVKCAVTGTIFDPVPAPQIAIIDSCALWHLQTVRAVTGSKVPIIASLTGHLPQNIRLCGPESLGGLGDPEAKINAEANKLGKSKEEVGAEIFMSSIGRLHEVPGIPAMYDYEFIPQKPDLDLQHATPLLLGIYNFLKDCDGAISPAVEASDSAAVNAMKTWFADRERSFHAFGPLLPDLTSQPDVSIEHTCIKGFLDNIHAQYGRRSLLYISFGSNLWPESGEYLEAIIEVLIEKEFPFILCSGSSKAIISQELIANIESSSFGILTQWAPQQYILEHSVTGWFLTHCGQGGTTESLRSGIPMICWPLEVDQPSAAAHLSEDLHVAFELVEVKGFVGRPMRRNGKAPQGSKGAVIEEFRRIVDACRGEDGKELRANAERLKNEYGRAWSEGGYARKEFGVFLDKYFPTM